MSAERYSIAALVGRLKLAIGRGRITQSDDSKAIQMVQVQLGPKEIADLKRMQLGVVTWPPDGTDVIAVFLAGDRSNGAVIAAHNLKGRFKLGNKGEVALHDYLGTDGAPGKWIWAKGSGAGWEIECNGEPVNIKDASAVTISPKSGGECPVTINTGGGNIALNMGGGNVTISNPGSVVLGPAGKKVVVDGDSTTGGHTVIASQSVVKA